MSLATLILLPTFLNLTLIRPLTSLYDFTYAFLYPPIRSAFMDLVVIFLRLKSINKKTGHSIRVARRTSNKRWY